MAKHTLIAAAMLPGLVATLLYMGAVMVVTYLRPEMGPGGPRSGRRRVRLDDDR